MKILLISLKRNFANVAAASGRPWKDITVAAIREVSQGSFFLFADATMKKLLYVLASTVKCLGII